MSGDVLMSRQRPVAGNLAGARAWMERAGIDALVATRPANVTWLTDWSCWLDGTFEEWMVRPGGGGHALPGFAVLPRAGAPVLVADAMLAANALDLEGVDLCPFGAGSLAWPTPAPALDGRLGELLRLLRRESRPATAVAALAQALRERRLDTARLGIELEGLAPPVAAALRQALPHAQLRDAANLFRLARMVKTPAETERLAQATAVGEQAAAASLAAAAPGVSARQLGERFRAEVSGRGADLDHFAFGVRGLGLATQPDYRLVAGDALYVDFGCRYRGYASDSGLTLAVGQLSAAQGRDYRALRDALAAGRDALRPGARASQVPAAMWRVLRQAGIEVCFPHGHGIGLQVRDYPILVADDGGRIRDDCVDEPADLSLADGMVLNLEAMIFAPGAGSLHVERSFVLGADGARDLAVQEREAPVVAGGA